MPYKVICTAYRASTTSSLTVELPQEIVDKVQESDEIGHAVDWIIEEFDGQFIPEKFLTPDGNYTIGVDSSDSCDMIGPQEEEI